MPLLLPLLLLPLLAAAAADEWWSLPGLLNVSRATGAYTLALPHASWPGAPPAFLNESRWRAAAFAGVVSETPQRLVLAFEPALTVTFEAAAGGDGVRFALRFGAGVARTGSGGARTVAAFPSFAPRATPLQPKPTLQALAWPSMWSPGVVTPLDAFLGGVGGGPVACFEPDSMAAFVLSTADNFQVSGLERLAAVVFNAEALPRGFVHSAVVVRGASVPAAMEAWGRVLLGLSGKVGWRRDVVTDTLGYYTDNGAYYYDRTMAAPNDTYDKTLTALTAHWRAAGVPVRYVQLDSWWYEWGDDHGVREWRPRRDNVTFPSGALPAALRDYPLQLHNRFWSRENVYGARYGVPFAESAGGGVGKGEAFPTGLQRELFEVVMGKMKESGLAVYEQDWLAPQSLGMDANFTTRNVSTARLWLQGMGDAATKLNVTILFCMPAPWHYLSSTQVQAVTSIRVSDDYYAYLRDRKPTWNIATTNMLAWSLGLWPTKDVFWSSPTNRGYWHSGLNRSTSEENPRRAALASVLSAGQVAFGDAAGQEDATLLRATCAAGGALLQPERSLVPIARMFSSRAPAGTQPSRDSGPTVAVTATREWLYVLATDLSEPYELEPSDFPSAGAADAYAVVVNGRVLPEPTQGGPRVLLPAGNLTFVALAPLSAPSGVAFLGELDTKLVPVSAYRLLHRDGDGVTLRCDAGEVLEVALFAAGATVKVGCPPCPEEGGGRVRVEYAERACRAAPSASL